MAPNVGRAKRNVTTSDIARLSGVSRSTVSAVLNGKRSVRESTRRKVLECIRQQNYESVPSSKAVLEQLDRGMERLAARYGAG